LAFAIAGSGNGSAAVVEDVDVVDVVDVEVVDVVDVDVVDVVDDVVDVDVVDVDVDVDAEVVEAGVDIDDVAESEPDADAPVHPAAITSAPTIRTTGRRRTPSR
jgi:hypothetical protein